MKIFYLLLSLLALLYGCICIYFNSRDIYIAKYGSIVQVRISYLPSHYCLTSGGPVHFVYEDVQFSENFPHVIVGDKKVGDFMLFHHIPKYRNDFVYVEKNIFLMKVNAAGGILVVACGMYLFYRAFWCDT